MTLAKAKARANKTFIVQASLMIVTCDRQNILTVQSTRGFLKTRKVETKGFLLLTLC